MKVRVLNGAVDIRNIAGEDRFILRGVIDPTTIQNIQVGEYQREAGSLSDLSKLIAAIKAGEQLPDVEIGIRGDNVKEIKGVHNIESDCFVVDGLQRLTAAKRVLDEMGMTFPLHLGALFHYSSSEEWERNRFKVLNLYRRKVSPNVILRNERVSEPVQALYNMSVSHDNFVLRGKISWGQKMGRGELVTALAALKAVGVLHNHWGPGLSSSLEQLVEATNKTFTIVGPNTWRANVRQFFYIIDQAFGLASISYRDLSPQVKGGFLRTMARVFADHQNFWDGEKLKIDPKDLAKLRQFPIRDPGILALVAGTGTVVEPLYVKLVEFLNSYRRTNRLIKWDGRPADGILSISTIVNPNGEDDFTDTDPGEN